MSLFTASKLSYLHSHYFSHPVTHPSCRCPALLVRTVEFEDTVTAPYFPFPSSVAQAISTFVADTVYKARKANSLNRSNLKIQVWKQKNPLENNKKTPTKQNKNNNNNKKEINQPQPQVTVYSLIPGNTFASSFQPGATLTLMQIGVNSPRCLQVHLCSQGSNYYNLGVVEISSSILFYPTYFTTAGIGSTLSNE